MRQVAEDSLFACAEPCERSRTAGLLEARPVAEPWLTAAIAFSGPFDGVVRMTLPRALAGDLAGAFCGVQPQSLDASQVDDFAGELANMVCGLWLTQTHRSERFELAPPVVARRGGARRRGDGRRRSGRAAGSRSTIRPCCSASPPPAPSPRS